MVRAIFRWRHILDFVLDSVSKHKVNFRDLVVASVNEGT